VKAVFVIDVPNELDVNNLLIDYCVHTKGEYKPIRKGGNHPLKLLPDHREIKGKWEDEVDVWIDGVNYGYNKCLEEIVGETE